MYYEIYDDLKKNYRSWQDVAEPSRELAEKLTDILMERHEGAQKENVLRMAGDWIGWSEEEEWM